MVVRKPEGIERQLPPGVPPLRLLAKVVRVMEAFTPAEPSLSLGEVIDRVELPATTVGRILYNLVALDVLEREGSRFRIGLATVAWAASALHGKSLVDLAHPVLARLRDATGETAYLVVRSGTHRICVAVEQSATPVRHAVEVGELVPLHGGSTGWVFLAFDTAFSHLSVDRMVELWPGAPVSYLGQVMDEVERARRAGYAVSSNWRVEGAAGIAVPVFDANKEMVAAVGLTGPCQRVTTEVLDKLQPLVRAAATDLAQLLGVPRQRE